MKRIILAALVGVLVSGPVFGGDYKLFGNMDCGDPTKRDDYRNRLISIVQEYTEMIEKVPPDETKYIQSEVEAAQYAGNEARFGMVMQRPYFRAHEVHRYAKHVIDALNSQPYRMLKFKNKSAIDALKLKTKSAIDAISKFSDFKASFFEYVDFDDSRRKRVLSKETREGIYSRLTLEQMYFENFSKCLVDAIN